MGFPPIFGCRYLKSSIKKVRSEYAKRKQEELQKILEAVQGSPYVKEQRANRDVQEEIRFHGSINRAMDFENELIHDFFEQELDDVVKVAEVWKWLQERVKQDLDGVWLDPKILSSRLTDKGYVASEQTVNDMFEGLCDELSRLNEETVKIVWRSTSLDQAKSVLTKGAYIAILDRKGKLTTEPHMVSIDPAAKVSCKNVLAVSRIGKIREIQVTVELPTKVEGKNRKMFGFRLGTNEVKAEAFSIP